jgi:hypothetical protein
LRDPGRSRHCGEHGVADPNGLAVALVHLDLDGWGVDRSEHAEAADGEVEHRAVAGHRQALAGDPPERLVRGPGAVGAEHHVVEGGTGGHRHPHGRSVDDGGGPPARGRIDGRHLGPAGEAGGEDGGFGPPRRAQRDGGGRSRQVDLVHVEVETADGPEGGGDARGPGDADHAASVGPDARRHGRPFRAADRRLLPAPERQHRPTVAIGQVASDCRQG